MRTFTLTIATTNSAFFDGHGEDVAGAELARILRDLAESLDYDSDPIPLSILPMGLFDINGNRVGLAEAR